MTEMGVRAAQRVLDRKTEPFSAMPATPARSRCPILAASPACFEQADKAMGFSVTDYVLVHGAWCGSWIWKRVRDRLATAGHRVFTPTLTGLGERSHLLDRRVGVQTHIDDVANLLVWEELRDIVLVGHSYAGFRRSPHRRPHAGAAAVAGVS